MQKIIIVIACLAAIAMAMPYKPVAKPEYDDSKDVHSHPQYKFEYGVKDDHTGDHKIQWEERDGDHVKGQYSQDDADGGQRVVEYESDAHGGINIQFKTVSGHASAHVPKNNF